VEGVGACGGQPGSGTREGRSLLADYHVAVEPTQVGAARHQRRGGLSRREERRGPAAAILRISRRRKTLCGGFCYNVRTPAAIFLDPAIVTMPYPKATHYRHAHLILESASPGRRRGSHSKQGCSTDARSVGGGYGRWLVFQTWTRVPD
jgi:hypothetical protein